MPFGASTALSLVSGGTWAGHYPEHLYDSFRDPARTVSIPVEPPAVEVGLPYILGPSAERLGPFLRATCKYCEARLEHDEIFATGPGNQPQREDVLHCKRCGWWLLAWAKTNVDGLHVRANLRESIVHSFDYEATDEPMTALRQRIAQRDLDPRSLSPVQLERLVGSVFRDFFQAEVRHVGASGDGGVDLLIVAADPPIAIQVKRRTARATESPSVIRELIGALVLRDLREGILITTAGRFTDTSHAAADSASLGRHGFKVSLYALDALLDIVDSVQPPEEPWLEYVWAHHLREKDKALLSQGGRQSMLERQLNSVSSPHQDFDD